MTPTSLPARQALRLIQGFEAGDYDYAAMEQLPVEDEPTVDTLLASLGSPEWRATLACTEALGRSQVAAGRVVPALVGLLHHPEESIRARAAEALGRLKARKAGPALLALLEREREPFTIRDVVRALGALGERAAVPRLARWLGAAEKARDAVEALHAGPIAFRRGPCADPFDLLVDVVRVLGGFPEAVPALQAAFGLALPMVRCEVLAALGRLGGIEVERVVEHLRGLCGKDDFEGSYEARLLIDALRPFPVSHAPLVRALLQAPFLPSADCLPASLEVLPLLVEGLSEPAIRERCVPMLGSLGPAAASAAPALVRVMEDEPLAVEALGGLGNDDGEVLAALVAYEARHRDALDRRSLARRALRRLGHALPPPADGRVPARQLGLPGRPTRRGIVVGGCLYVPFHQVLYAVEPSAWHTDDDAFGVVAIAQDMAYHRLPLNFPGRPTGASGARRQFRLVCELNGRLVFVLQAPFADERGWGDDNYLYAFDPADAAWSRLCPDRPLIPGNEDPSHSFGHGELVVWADERGGLQVATDATPYHLDDWDMDPRTCRAMQQARDADEAIPGWELAEQGGDIWVLQAPDGERVTLYDMPDDAWFHAAAWVGGQLAVVVARPDGGELLYFS